MTDREVFERAIVANPCDEAYRLIYADYLEEQGNEELALAMRQTTSEGRKIWGLMPWRVWDKWCLQLVPKAITYIELDWSEILTVVHRQAKIVAEQVHWSYAFVYNRCSLDVRHLLQSVDTPLSWREMEVHSVGIVSATVTPAEYLSKSALWWVALKTRLPELVGVVDSDQMLADVIRFATEDLDRTNKLFEAALGPDVTYRIFPRLIRDAFGNITEIDE